MYVCIVNVVFVCVCVCLRACEFLRDISLTNFEIKVYKRFCACMCVCGVYVVCMLCVCMCVFLTNFEITVGAQPQLKTNLLYKRFYI